MGPEGARTDFRDGEGVGREEAAEVSRCLRGGSEHVFCLIVVEGQRG